MQFQPQPGSSDEQQVHDASRILVVDDHEHVREVLEELLVQAGYVVDAAETAERAMLCLDTAPPDLIVCDVMMPDMNGFELHHTIRNNHQWCHIPFIFLTALAGEQEVCRGKADGCDDYLVKPFEPDHLLSVIEGKISLSRIRESLSREKLEHYSRRIINTLSHEFRTPLVAINTGSELLLDQLEALDPNRVRNLLMSIYRGGQRLQRLVNDFMALQSIDSGSAAQTYSRLRRALPCSDIIRSAVEMIEEQPSEGPRQELAVRIPPELRRAAVYCYDTQITDVLGRILANAFKFGDKDKPIEVWISESPQTLRIHVRDYGPGLSEQVALEAMRTFSQIERDKYEQQGAGLGLAIANYFTELNGGELHFLRPENGGLEVVLELPRVPQG